MTSKYKVLGIGHRYSIFISIKPLRVFDNLLLDHVGLHQVVILAVHLVIFVLDGLRGSS